MDGEVPPSVACAGRQSAKVPIRAHESAARALVLVQTPGCPGQVAEGAGWLAGWPAGWPGVRPRHGAGPAGEKWYTILVHTPYR